MNALFNIITTAGVTFASAVPVFAEAHMGDPVTLTCAEFSAVDITGMMKATHSMDMAMAMAMTEVEMTAALSMTDEEKTAMQAEIDAAMAAMTEDETAAATTATETSTANIVTASSAMPDGTVIDAVKAGM